MKKKNSKKDNSFRDLLYELMPEKLTSGQAIKAKRKNFGITLAEVEEVTGISQSNLSLYENDKKPIGLLQATKIGYAIGLHPMTILFPNGLESDPKLKKIAAKGKKLLEKKIPLKDIA
jgi:transcriptional regulator with XRE-family HTH domain